MPTTQPASLSPAVVLRLLREHAWLWVAPAVAGLLLTAGATLITPRKWKASQGLIVRSEAAGYGEQRLGKFTDLSEMRTVQETILEVARSRRVLAATLEQVGEPGWFSRGAATPSLSDIEDLRDNLEITPPGGAVFGATEVFYLTVYDKNSTDAVKLCDALCGHLIARMQELRNQQAGSMTVELQNAATAARAVLAEHTGKLADAEASVGADLGDLRSLVSPLGGRGALAEKALSVEAELRDSETGRRRATQLLATLRDAQANPSRLLATPSALLVSQPALQRLKDGLVDAQIRAASLQASRSPSHPFVVAAKAAEERLRAQLHNEVPAAIAGVEMELSLSHQREAALRAELKQVRGRVATLAARRAEYSSLVSAVENQRRLVDAAEAQLADARAHSAGAAATSFLERVDSVEAGARPEGPGRATVSLAGGLGGMILGVGLVFAFYAPKGATPEDAVVRPQTWDQSFPTPSHATQPTADTRQAVGAGYGRAEFPG
ncbi:MAG: hypothetical protein AAF790_03775 [Planctomycetota bacterium]